MRDGMNLVAKEYVAAQDRRVVSVRVRRCPRVRHPSPTRAFRRARTLRGPTELIAAPAASFAPLRLVRDEHPSTRWSESQYSVMSGGLVVGRISNDASSVPPGAPPWRWAINGVHAAPTVMQIVGNAATLEEAQQELAENWRRWLAWAALAQDCT
jgi:hypothetical protein